MTIEEMYESVDNHSQYHDLRNSGMLWELFPEAPEYWAAYKEGRDEWLAKKWRNKWTSIIQATLGDISWQ